MINAPDRLKNLQLIEEAVAAGARRAQACAELGLLLCSLQRWQNCPEDRLGQPFPVALTTHALYVCSPGLFGITA